MAFVSPRMSLKVWNSASDPYDHEQLADNFLKLDMHDHSPGRGQLIGSDGIRDGAILLNHLAPGALSAGIGANAISSVMLQSNAVTTAKIQDAAVTSAKLATGLDATGVFGVYRNVWTGYCTLPASTVAGTYAVAPGNPSAQAAATYLGGHFYLNPADYAVSGRTTSFYIDFNVLSTTSTSPGQTISVGLSPVTAVTGGTLTLSGAPLAIGMGSPAGNTLNHAKSGAYTPLAGYYMLTCSVTGTTAALSNVSVWAALQMRHI
jgi:hypothetical protein